jgi:Domain of unknown function (DUF4926)
MKIAFEQFEVVRYTGPYIEDTGLAPGDIGTILEVYDAENFEVEFCFPDGSTKELFGFNISQLEKAT